MKLATVLACVLASAASPALAETWHVFSRSTNSAYMADVDTIAVDGDVTTIKVAIVPLRGDPGDYSHTVDTYEFRCGAGQWRSPLSVEHGPDGAETDQYPDNGDWTPARDNTVPGILKEIACDGVRAQPPLWSAVKDFIDAGRPGAAR